MDELRDATRALDRVIMHSASIRCPTCTGRANRVSRWDKFGIPATVPKYYTIATPNGDWLAVGGHGVVVKDEQAAATARQREEGS